ncbi:signal peptidase II [Mesosutterella multiformis]|jgi:signal peptidase II|uniref:Lipoprotein signal peptidase n=1 Tax=Mesosutterella multiformis TaxID=2259133 RepID=A0A388SBG5_9BURK|nr:signal peptidase II [Mesosutterella multiformis]MCH3934445.1 signal peptidase II [Mesosutterella sp.]RGU79922.1 signal peptidase II [Sutterella sp. AF15-45LB]RGU80766.1 signal peptidase II [Sutterella sp. AF15-44LB]RHH05909.1 signal peptidase II [Sutterella sp. AM18-8-1]MCH3936971.1 signal peptidase II [Mesosutterella sp.]
MASVSRSRTGAILWFALALLVILADQASKAWANDVLAASWIQVTGFFNLVLLRNTGSAFSFLADAGGWQKLLFSAVAIGVSAAMAAVIWKHSAEKLAPAAAALVLGGAIGNLIDRLMLGSVTDFIDLHIGDIHWPAFNIADSAIVLGVIFFILIELRKK